MRLSIALSYVDGGVGINLSRSIGEKPRFMAFIHDLLYHGGFDGDPRTVAFKKNKLTPEGMKIDWFRLRIEGEECRMHDVFAPTVVCNMARWLRSEDCRRAHGMDISLNVKGISESDCPGAVEQPPPRQREPVGASAAGGHRRPPRHLRATISLQEEDGELL